MQETLIYVSHGIVLLAGLYLVTLASLIWIAPSRAQAFLLAFAATSRIHYFEMAVRVLVGVALIWASPRMAFSAGFLAFGWLLILTSLVLCLLPWRIHHRFASLVMPKVILHMPWFGLAAFGGGALIIGAAIRGGTA